MALTPEQIQQYRQQFKIGQKEQPQSSTVGSLLGLANSALRSTAQGIENVSSYVTEPLNRAASAMNRGLEKVTGLDGVDQAGQKLLGNLGQKYQENVPQPVRDLVTVGSVAVPAIKTASPLLKAGATAAKDAAAEAALGTRQAVGGAVESTGQKIQTTSLKPSVQDLKDGFKVENLTKYNVGGSPQEILAKSQVELNKRAQAIKTLAGESDAFIDMNKVYENAAKSLMANKTKSFGDNGAITSVLEKLKGEIDAVAPEGATSFSEALDIRRSASNKGAWAYNRPDPDAKALEEVYTAFYQELKKEMDSVAPEGFKELNRQISDLIPVQNAAMRRVPVEERNNALGLLETIGLAATVYDPSALMLTITARATKSGKVGNALTKAGQAIKGDVPSAGTKSSKPSTVTNTSTSNVPTERGGASVPKTDTSGGFDGGFLKEIDSIVKNTSDPNFSPRYYLDTVAEESSGFSPSVLEKIKSSNGVQRIGTVGDAIAFPELKAMFSKETLDTPIYTMAANSNAAARAFTEDVKNLSIGIQSADVFSQSRAQTLWEEILHIEQAVKGRKADFSQPYDKRPHEITAKKGASFYSKQGRELAQKSIDSYRKPKTATSGGVKGVPSAEAGLIAEAKKYKSAEQSLKPIAPVLRDDGVVIRGGGYGTTKSVNASIAEANGKFRSSILAKQFNLKPSTIEKMFVSYESHHFGKNFDKLPVYDINDFTPLKLKEARAFEKNGSGINENALTKQERTDLKFMREDVNRYRQVISDYTNNSAFHDLLEKKGDFETRKRDIEKNKEWLKRAEERLSMRLQSIADRQKSNETVGSKPKTATSGGVKGVPSAEAGLIAEAKKYKSAEEFVKAQGKKFVHETDAPDIKEFTSGKAGQNTGDSWLGRGVYLQEDGTLKLEKYGKNKVEAFLSPEAKVFEVKDTPNGKWRDTFVEEMAKRDPEGMTKWVMEDKFGNFKSPMARDFLMNKSPKQIEELLGQKYDALLQDGELVVYNPSLLKTKSQLEEIWKKANKKP